MTPPDYMDNGSVNALPDPRFQKAANNLIWCYRNEMHNSRAKERDNVERLLAKLKQALAITDELSPNNRHRIFNYRTEPDNALTDLVEATKQVIEKPLPMKRKQENLYHAMAFDYLMIERKQPTLSRTDIPNLFQKFMSVIVCRIEGNPGYMWGEYVARTTKHYHRYIQPHHEHYMKLVGQNQEK